MTKTEDRPAEAGLEEVEEEPVALQCQMPGTKQRARSQILKQHLLGSAWETGHPPQSSTIGTAVHHFQRAWHCQGSAKGRLGKHVYWVRSWACPMAKQPSVSAILVDVDSTLNVLKWRGLMQLAALWSTNQRTWSVQESKILVCDILFWRWQSWNVHITKYHSTLRIRINNQHVISLDVDVRYIQEWQAVISTAVTFCLCHWYKFSGLVHPRKFCHPRIYQNPSTVPVEAEVQKCQVTLDTAHEARRQAADPV